MGEFRLSDYYTPLDSQKPLHDSLAKFKASIGGFGSGKTRWLIWECIMESLDKPGNKGVICRATYGELDDTLQDEFLGECPDEIKKKWEKTKRKLTLINGSVILFRAFDRVKKIKSLDLGWFAFDQAEEMDERFFMALIGRIRRVGFKTKGFLAANYVPRSWVVRMFIHERKNDARYACVVANANQNKFLDPDFIQTMLDIYPESWVNRYVNLCMADIEKDDDGRRFKFTEAHYVNRKDLPYIFEKRPNPEHVKFAVGIDAGVGSPTAVMFVMIDMREYVTKLDGLVRVCFFDEIYEVDKSVEQITYLIKVKLRRYGFMLADGSWNPNKKIWQFLIDPNTNRKQQGGKTVENVFRMYQQFGIPVVPSNNDRAYGIMRMMGLIENKLLYVCRECENFIVEGQKYLKDPGKDHIDDVGVDEFPTEDLPPKKQRDHALDGGRYVVVKLPVYWFSKLLKHKDNKAKEALNERVRSTGAGRRRSMSALSRIGGGTRRKEHWVQGKRVSVR